MLKKLLIPIAALTLVGCANRGSGPQGGPKDSIPPVAVRSLPENGSVAFHDDRIEIYFNEYLQLDNISQNLLMSPPQQHPPEVKARGKRVLVQFVDSLRDSTTYTIDFGNAICDFTEKNPFVHYTFSFSTGDIIDTLEAFGRVYDAENLNPVENILVGIQDDLSDSAFTSAPLLRIAKTNADGLYYIGNMRQGTYRLYALEDISRDYRLTLGEAFAFADSTIVPDTVEQNPLLLFKEQQQRLYMAKSQRDKQHWVHVLFSAAPDSLPRFRPLSDSVRIHTAYSPHGDTVTVWLLDSTSIAQDSIYLEVCYRATDSLYHLEWVTDTIRAIWRAPKLSAKALKALQKKNRNRRLELKSNARNNFELFDTLRVTCTTPLVSVERDSIHLFERVDSIIKPLPFTLAPFDSLTQQLTIHASFQPGKIYELHLDSAALHDVYGISHKAQKMNLTVKKLEDYSTLRVTLNPYLPDARIQVLNAQDKVVRELPADPAGTFFRYLKPETYYLRLYRDTNLDGQWTTGEWKSKRQPEPVYYYPEKIQTKSNWDFEEEWNYLVVPQMEAKPAELIKAAAKKK